jgi:beta-lactamase class A
MCLTFIIGFLISALWQDNPLNPLTETRLQGNYKFINPLLECDSAGFGTDTELDHLKTRLQTYIQQQSDSKKVSFVSVYYRDLNNGPWFGININESFSPSSLIKVPLLIAYLKEAQTDPGILDKTLTNTKTFDPTSVNFPPENTLVQNQKYSVRELLSRMIVYSDNLAYGLLNENMDSQSIIRVYNDLGVDISKGNTDPNGNIISVKNYASFFRILYNASYLNPDMSEYALKLLSQSKFVQGLAAGLPSGTIVAHKFGERQYLDTGQKQLHDCGIVYLPENPYLVCIMTRGQNFNNLTGTIRDISSTIYQYITSHP